MRFFIDGFNSKLQETLRTKGFKGAVKAKGVGSNNFQITISGFKKDNVKAKEKQIQAQPKQQKYLKPQIKVPEIVMTGKESVEELKAKATELSIFKDKIRNEPYKERVHLEDKVRRLTNQIEGRINEIKMGLGAEVKAEQSVKQEAAVVKEIVPKQAKGGPKKGLRHERRFIGAVEELGMPLEGIIEMHAEAVKEHEEIIKSLKDSSFKNSVVYSRMGQEEFKKILEAEETRLALLKKEKQHLESLSRLKRPVSKVLPASFLQKLFKRDIKTLNKEIKEKRDLIAKRTMEEKELGRIAKWRKKRK